MFKGFKLTKEYIQFEDVFESWEKAIEVACKPLLKGKKIKESYIEGIIDSVKEHGPYIVIAPNVALPHARPETDSLEIAFSVMITKEPVSFDKAKEFTASLFITLSCVDAETHIEILQHIVSILSDQDKCERLINAKTKEEVLEIFE
jgi:mannitol/fructose-specific phosphotransferase system IIA component (Ntr-type)